MLVTYLHAKIHRAVVTARDINYHGSVTIDENLLEATGMRPSQQIQVYDSNNGARFETYILRGAPGSGEIQINGAAARLVEVGDRIIICTYAQMTPEEATDWHPRVVLCGEGNSVMEVINYD